MKTRTINIINGGIAFYFAISCFLGAIAGLVGMGIFLFEVLTSNAPFVWWQFAMFLGIFLISGGMAYVLLRVGKEQLED